tara:strand:- start:1194 stop:2456 length:1263 start_codon:yes stop_codon:yes gene_type:complete
LTYKIKYYLNSLFSLQRRGIKLGLEHTESLLKFLDNPHEKFLTIHVAGTNGKGSTCAYIEKILIDSGYKVGMYTSPHLFSFNERIRVDGLPISDQEIVSFLDNTFKEINKIGSTFFEVTTAMAFDYFSKKKVDIAVIETGLGGRLDATNVIRPVISVITSISMDHTEILGDSIEQIAKEKSGIIKEKIPLFVYRQDSNILEVFQKKAITCRSEMKISKIPKNININSRGTQFTLNNQDYMIPLFGSHQARNAALAIDVVSRFDSKIKYDVVYNALKKVFWPGRMQKIGQRIFYDVSHNKKGMEETLQTLKKLYPGRDIHGLLCLKKGKELTSLKSLILKNFKTLITSGDQKGFLLKSNILAKQLTEINIYCNSASTIKDGSIMLKKLVKNNSSIGLIFGSHYIGEEVFNAFEISFDNYYI